MQLKTKNGIICDFTGMVYKDQFVYYFGEFFLVKVSTSLKYVFPPKKTSEFDFGKMFYESIIDKASSITTQEVKNVIPCDWCGTKNTGDFSYSLIKISSVDVDCKRENKTIIDKNILQLRFCTKCVSKLNKMNDEVLDKVKKSGDWS